MREKPKNTVVSELTWTEFNKIADNKGYGDDIDDWLPWFEIFEAGYIIGCFEES